MTRAFLSAAAIASLVLLASGPASSQVLLQNDGYVDGASVGFQAGFVAGERGASRLVPADSVQVLIIEFLFGGSTATENVNLLILDDDGGGSTPGTVLHQSGPYAVTGSDQNLQQIDISGANLVVDGPFHVALEFTHSGPPGIARDTDGSILAGHNFIYTDLGGGPAWFDSQLFGLTGDWIIRAWVQGPGLGGDEPQILTIDDVGNDQGRQVRLRFARSAQDEGGASTPITQYEILRRVDNLGRGFGDTSVPTPLLDGWDYVGAVPAHGEDVYSLVAPTLADSTIANGQHWSVFFVRAATVNPIVFYDSAPDSGYSLDNLAPAPPGNLVRNGGDIAWDVAPEEDFDYFTVYGSDVPVLDGSETMLTQTVATSYTIGGAPYAYVLVTATDFSGNEGEPGVTSLATGAPVVAPGAMELRAWPNPFGSSTSVSFELPRAGAARVEVFDAAGRLVRELASGPQAAGRHTLEWNGRDAAGSGVANGVYLIRLVTAGRVEQQKVVLLR